MTTFTREDIYSLTPAEIHAFAAAVSDNADAVNSALRARGHSLDVNTLVIPDRMDRAVRS